VDGFNATRTNDGCIPLQKCKVTEFNSAQGRADCGGDHQFCRNGYCYCKPNYEFNNVAECVPQAGVDFVNAIKAQNKSPDSEWKQEILHTNARLDKITQLIATTLLIILILITLLTIFVYTTYRKIAQRYSKNNCKNI